MSEALKKSIETIQIKLTDVKLVNWYGFTNSVILPFGDMTFVTAENKVGKSTLMDAMKYCLFGDTEFNPASETGRDRKIDGYVRGLINSEGEKYMRPADTHPDVYCHIAVGFYSEGRGPFVLDTLVHSYVSGPGFEHRTSRYIFDGKTIKDIENLIITEEGIPATEKDFKKLIRENKLIPATVEDFFNRMGLRFKDELITNFNSKMRKITAYKPARNVSEFIKANVLEEHKIETEDLKKCIREVKNMREKYAELVDESASISEISKLSDRIEDIETKIIKSLMLEKHIQIENGHKEIKAAEERKAKAETVVEQKREERRKAGEEIKVNETVIRTSKEAQDKGETTKTIRILEDQIALNEEKKKILETEITKIEEFVESASSIQNLCPALKTADKISSLKDEKFPLENKYAVFNNFLRLVNDQIQEDYKASSDNADELDVYEKEKRVIESRLRDYEKNRVNYDDLSDCTRMRNAINSALNKAGSKGCAKMAFEYVSEIKDEKWRKSIEAFLGRNRYTIIVSDKDFDVAMNVFKSMRDTRTHLFNTKLLMKKETTVVEDSVVKQLVVADPVAKKFFEYKLGRLHAVELKDVDKYEESISAEGLVSVAMDMYYLNFDRIGQYRLGQESIEINRANAQARLSELIKLINELNDRKSKIDNEYTRLSNWRDLHSDKREFSAISNLSELLHKQDELQQQLASLQEAKKNDREYMALQYVINEAEEKIEALKRSIAEADVLIDNKRQEIRDSEYKINSTTIEINNANNVLMAEREKHYDIYTAMIKEYEEEIIKNGTYTKPSIKQSTRERYEDEKNKLTRDRTGALLKYSQRFHSIVIDVSTENEAETLRKLEARFRKINQEDNPNVKIRLEEQERNYDETLKTSFILTIYNHCISAKSTIQELSAQLKNLKFIDSYTFKARMVEDGDFGKILEYAEYLKEQKDNFGDSVTGDQLTFNVSSRFSDEKVEELQKDLKEIFNKLLALDESESEKQELLDYRNYMTYSLKSIDKNGKEFDYESHVVRTGSGAEVQIPYNLVLISALISVYSKRTECIKLLFMDEPFEKMSEYNVKIIMQFLKDMNLQGIFFAADKPSVGEMCDAVITMEKNQSTGETTAVDVDPRILFAKLKQVG